MAPAVETPVDATATAISQLKLANQSSALPKPLVLSGALDHIKQFDVTTIIGREFVDVQVKDLINSPDADALLRDLAITVSQRGVVFFRNQDLEPKDLKFLVQRLGELTGKPADSGLHIHPVINAEREGGLGGTDNEISHISNVLNKSLFNKAVRPAEAATAGTFAAESVPFTSVRQTAANLWHSDITFEPAPADYTTLHLVQLPETGGDTLWASGYELYDRLSKPYQEFLSTLTGTYAQPAFNQAADLNGFKVYSKPRGSPHNVGEVLTAISPIIRTNPVTGWRSVFAVGHHVQRINDLSDRESRHLLDEFVRLITENHDLQVRFKWGQNDLAIWDNRSAFHTATEDVNDGDVRSGNRAVSIGERPYLDPASTGRREALGQKVPLARKF